MNATATVAAKPPPPSPPAKAPPRKPPAGTVHWFNECVERGRSEMFSDVTTVTPGLAAFLLSRNPDNRNISGSKLEQFESDMRAGRWALNGENLIISRDGLLNDGQHRLRALIEANVTVPMNFTFGAERASRLTVDIGRARTAADFLGMEGEENATTAAGIARLLIAIERENGARLWREGHVTTSEIQARVRRDKRVAEAASYAMQHYHYTRAFAPPAIVGTAYYLLTDVHPTDGCAFMDAVCVGEELRRDTPAYAVRDTLLPMTRGRKAAKLEVILRGWVKHRKGESMKMVKVLGHFPELD